VSSIVSTLKPHHRADFIGKQIDYLAFAFVTPLSADDDYITSHSFTLIMF
jgi:hypothetical protein